MAKIQLLLVLLFISFTIVASEDDKGEFYDEGEAFGWDFGESIPSHCWNADKDTLIEFSKHHTEITKVEGKKEEEAFKCGQKIGTQRTDCEKAAQLSTLNQIAQTYYEKCVLTYYENEAKNDDSTCKKEKEACKACTSNKKTCKSIANENSDKQDAYEDFLHDTDTNSCELNKKCPTTLTQLAKNGCIRYEENECLKDWMSENASDDVCYISSECVKEALSSFKLNAVSLLAFVFAILLF